jgi:hypothetical protein
VEEAWLADWHAPQRRLSLLEESFVQSEQENQTAVLQRQRQRLSSPCG